MTKFKRYIKNVFSIAGLEWRKTNNIPLGQTGILLSKLNNKSAANRSQIKDEQYMLNVQEFADLIQSLLPGQPYNSNYPLGVVDKDVGNIPAGTPFSDLDGLLVTEIFDKIFFISPAEIILNPSRILTIDIPDPIVEVGLVVHFEAAAFHIQGAIASANGSPTVELEGDATQFTFEDATGVTVIPAAGNAQAYIGTDFGAVSGLNFLNCTVEWGQGTGIYFDEAGTQMHAYDTLRAAGSELVTGSIVGLYKAFAGSGAAFPVDVAAIRALSSDFLDINNNGEFEFVIPAGDVLIFFYVPTDGGTHTVKVSESDPIDSLNLTSSFTLDPEPNMEDAGGNIVPYDRYSFSIGGIGYAEDHTYKVIVT